MTFVLILVARILVVLKDNCNYVQALSLTYFIQLP